MTPAMFDRIVARVRARTIDDELLQQQLAPGNRPLVLRRARLLRRDYRTAVANALRRLIEEARRSRRTRFTATLPLKVREVLDSAPLILTLADEVEQDDGINPRGVILAERLVTSGDSPVYGLARIRRSREGSVDTAVRHARAALHLG
jgi:hypothetical protein